MNIVDLTSENNDAMVQTARLLVDGFCDTGSAVWKSMEEALADVRESLQPDRISRIAVDDHSEVLGWIGGTRQYSGNAWELQPLVIRRDRQRRGIGRKLVADFEEQVAQRGGCTVFLGTDDENCRTTLGGIDLYPDILDKLRAIRNRGQHPFEFYLKIGYHIVGVVPDANGFGKPDILMAKRVRAHPDRAHEWLTALKVHNETPGTN